MAGKAIVFAGQVVAMTIAGVAAVLIVDWLRRSRSTTATRAPWY